MKKLGRLSGIKLLVSLAITAVMLPPSNLAFAQDAERISREKIARASELIGERKAENDRIEADLAAVGLSLNLAYAYDGALILVGTGAVILSTWGVTRKLNVIEHIGADAQALAVRKGWTTKALNHLIEIGLSILQKLGRGVPRAAALATGIATITLSATDLHTARERYNEELEKLEQAKNELAALESQRDALLRNSTK